MMADSSPGISRVGNKPYSSTDLQHLQGLLKSKNTTTRFVGLAILKSLLDSDTDVRSDAAKMTALWESISAKFLDRLLEAPQNQNSKMTKQEAHSLVDIAVAVLHTFSTLLPDAIKGNIRMLGRTGSLVNALLKSSPETTVLILQTLLTFVSLQSGAIELLSIEDLSPMIEIGPQQPLVLDIIGLAWANCSTDPSQAEIVLASMNKIVPSLLVTFKNTDAVTLLVFFADTIPRIPREVLPQNPLWLGSLTSLLRQLIASRPTIVGRAAYTEASSVLLQTFQAPFSNLLFQNGPPVTDNAKPFSYLFVSLILIDLRSSFPSLLSKLNDLEYLAIAKRLSSAFDVLSAFIGVLVTSLDSYETGQPGNSSSLELSPENILKLRKDIGETMSLTIEYLRDRWDASIAGAAGLHESARSGTVSTLDGSPLTITWDSMKENIYEDQLVLAALQALSVWLREDDSERLRIEGAALTDMFVELYQAESNLSFKRPILVALEGVMFTDEGLENFKSHKGWEALALDLKSIVAVVSSYSSSDRDNRHALRPILILESDRGTEIIHVLLAVIDHESTMEPREEWMQLVECASTMTHSNAIKDHAVLNFYISMLLLAAALLRSSSPGMRRQYKLLLGPLQQLQQDLELDVRGLPSSIRPQIQRSLDAAAQELESCI